MRVPTVLTLLYTQPAAPGADREDPLLSAARGPSLLLLCFPALEGEAGLAELSLAGEGQECWL